LPEYPGATFVARGNTANGEYLWASYEVAPEVGAEDVILFYMDALRFDYEYCELSPQSIPENPVMPRVVAAGVPGYEGGLYVGVEEHVIVSTLGVTDETLSAYDVFVDADGLRECE
jgi:hypothetical protein